MGALPRPLKVSGISSGRGGAKAMPSPRPALSLRARHPHCPCPWGPRFSLDPDTPSGQLLRSREPSLRAPNLSPWASCSHLEGTGHTVPGPLVQRRLAECGCDGLWARLAAGWAPLAGPVPREEVHGPQLAVSLSPPAEEATPPPGQPQGGAPCEAGGWQSGPTCPPCGAQGRAGGPIAADRPAPLMV